MPASQTLTASRNATWAPTLAYVYGGPQLPLTGAHIAMQLRLYGGAAGDALLTLPDISFADVLTAGVAGETDEVRTLTLSPVVQPGDPVAPTAATWAAMPPGAEPGDSLLLAGDIRITYADGVSEILSTLTFILSPGVTLV